MAGWFLQPECGKAYSNLNFRPITSPPVTVFQGAMKQIVWNREKWLVTRRLKFQVVVYRNIWQMANQKLYPNDKQTCHKSIQSINQSIDRRFNRCSVVMETRGCYAVARGGRHVTHSRLGVEWTANLPTLAYTCPDMPSTCTLDTSLAMCGPTWLRYLFFRRL